MARGLDQHQARAAAVAALGRGLSRRARSGCELCGVRTSLAVVEILPALEDPDEEHAALLCERCAALAQDARRRTAPETLRFLEEASWSDVAPVQVLAVRLVQRLSGEGVDWAQVVLDGLYLAPEIEERV